MTQNLYLPHLAGISDIVAETPTVKTFTVSFRDEKLQESFTYNPGQFLEVSVFGVGEAPISISSAPTREKLKVSIKKMGKVTGSIHDADINDTVGVRGPYGNGFPIEKLGGRDILFIGGGIGLAPLRSLINYMLDKRGDFGRIYILYGARDPSELVFRDELKSWGKRSDVDVHITVDKADDGWKGNVGVVPGLLKKITPSVKKTTAVICGPPIMIKYTIKALIDMKLKPDQIVFSLERMMKCGVGMCGHCSIGGRYVCRDGPVFTYEQMRNNLEFML